MPKRLVRGAGQGAVVIFRPLVACEVIERFKLATASLAIGKFAWTIDHVPMTARSAVVSQHGKAVAPNSARLAQVLSLAAGLLLRNLPLLALFHGTGRSGLDMPDAWGRRRHEAALDWSTWQKRALIG